MRSLARTLFLLPLALAALLAAALTVLHVGTSARPTRPEARSA